MFNLLRTEIPISSLMLCCIVPYRDKYYIFLYLCISEIRDSRDSYTINIGCESVPMSYYIPINSLRRGMVYLPRDGRRAKHHIRHNNTVDTNIASTETALKCCAMTDVARYKTREIRKPTMIVVGRHQPLYSPNQSRHHLIIIIVIISLNVQMYRSRNCRGWR